MLSKVRIILLSLSVLMVLAASVCEGAVKNVALLIDGDPTLKGGFNHLCVSGLKYASGRYPNKIVTKVFRADEAANVTAAEAAEAALKWSDLLIASSPAFTNYLNQAAPLYPDVTIISFDGEKAGNIKRISFRDEEGGFLAGALAAQYTQRTDVARINEEKKIGIVLGVPSVIMDNFKRGFIAGAWYIDKNVKVSVEYSNDYQNKDNARSIALKMAEDGVDIIFAVTGNAGRGVIDAARSHNFWVIGVDTEEETRFPDVVLTSVIKRSGLAVYNVIERYVSRTQIEDLSLGVKEDCISLSTWTRESKDNIPADIRKKMEEIDEKLEGGLIIIYSTFPAAKHVSNLEKSI